MWVLPLITCETTERWMTAWKGPLLGDNADVNSLTAGHLQLEKELEDDIDTSSPAARHLQPSKEQRHYASTSSPAVGPAESSEEQRRPQLKAEQSLHITTIHFLKFRFSCVMA